MPDNMENEMETLGPLKVVKLGDIYVYGLYRDDGNYNGNYYLGFRV